MDKLSSSQIEAALPSVREWKKQGTAITRTFQFEDFPAAMTFVNGVAEVAEKEWHHPDIDIRWNKVTLTLSTHDAGGLSERDIRLAHAIDEVAPERDRRPPLP